MKKKNQIGWQKFEDVISKQMNSPLLKRVTREIFGKKEEDDYAFNAHSYEEDEEDDDLKDSGASMLLQINEKLLENIALASNFNCWLGHCNFDITEDLVNKINLAEGVEGLKVLSRYRFFVGVATMFDFSEVRRNIENAVKSEDTE